MLRLTEPHEVEAERRRWRALTEEFLVPLAWMAAWVTLVLVIAEAIRVLSGRWF